MPQPKNYKQDWEKAKTEIQKIGQEALKALKQGEKELAKFTRKSQFQIDATSSHLKKEHFYYLIGKEYIHGRRLGKKAAKLEQLVSEFLQLEKEEKALEKKIESIK